MIGHVTKIVTENVGDVTKTTTHLFESSEDFLRWERGQVSDQEEKMGGEALRRYRVIGNVSAHWFEVGEEVEVISIKEDGALRVSNGEEEWWMKEEELEEV